MANNELLDRVLHHIKTNPETWDQGNWRCGARYCFAGHAALMGGWKPVKDEESIVYWKLQGYESLETAIEYVDKWYGGASMDPERWTQYKEDYHQHLLDQLHGIVPNTSDLVTPDGWEIKSIALAAQELLEIDRYSAEQLFSAANNLEDLERMVQEIKENGHLGHCRCDCPEDDAYGCERCNDC